MVMESLCLTVDKTVPATSAYEYREEKEKSLNAHVHKVTY